MAAAQIGTGRYETSQAGGATIWRLIVSNLCSKLLNTSSTARQFLGREFLRGASHCGGMRVSAPSRTPIVMVMPIARGSTQHGAVMYRTWQGLAHCYKPDAPASEPVTARSTRWRVGLVFVPFLPTSAFMCWTLAATEFKRRCWRSVLVAHSPTSKIRRPFCGSDRAIRWTINFVLPPPLCRNSTPA